MRKVENVVTAVNFLSLPKPEELFHSGEGIKVGHIKKMRMLLPYLIVKVNIR